MKIIYMALQNFKHDIVFVILLLLELVIGVFFFSSALGSIMSVYEQMNLCDQLNLSNAVYMFNGENEEDYYPIPDSKNLYLPYGSQEAELAIMSSKLCQKLGFSFDNANDDALEVIVNDRLSDTYQIGNTYMVATSRATIKVKVIGTYKNFRNILDENALGEDILNSIYLDFICNSDSSYIQKHKDIMKRDNSGYGRLYIFGDEKSMNKFLQNNEESISIQKRWMVDFWQNKNNIFMLITSIIFLLLSIAAVVSSKALRALNHRKKDSILKINGAPTSRLLLLSAVEDIFLFLPLLPFLYLILMIKDKIMFFTDKMTIVYLTNHPTWNFLRQIVDPISMKTICIAVGIYFFLYLIVSSLVYYGMNSRSIAQVYGDLQ